MTVPPPPPGNRGAYPPPQVPAQPYAPASRIRQIEQAVSHFQPRVYLGVQRTKGMLGRH